MINDCNLIEDKWLLTSGWQKAVRRCDIEPAVRIAEALWCIDKRKLLNRMAVISCEDVGIGNPDGVVQVLTALNQRPDLQTVLKLTTQLCLGAKNRLADAVYITAERSATYYTLRGIMASADDKLLINYVVDESKPLVERCLAVWYLAGTNRYPSEVIPPRIGSLEKAIAAIMTLNVPTPFVQACIGGLKLMRWPLPIFLPLIWQEAQKHPIHIRQHVISEMPTIDGLPLYAADCFTRVGKACYRQLQRNVLELKEYSTQQIGLGMFYLEGGFVDKEMTAPGLKAIQQASEITDIGLPVPEYEHLRDCLTSNMELLTAIRRSHLQRHFADLRKPDVGA